MSWGHYDWSKKECPLVKKWNREQEERAKARKKERIDSLRKKYHDCGFHSAVMQLFYRETRLTISDIAEILQTTETEVENELDIMNQRAQ